MYYKQLLGILFKRKFKNNWTKISKKNEVLNNTIEQLDLTEYTEHANQQ